VNIESLGEVIHLIQRKQGDVVGIGYIEVGVHNADVSAHNPDRFFLDYKGLDLGILRPVGILIKSNVPPARDKSPDTIVIAITDTDRIGLIAMSPGQLQVVVGVESAIAI
jgi:hypothetical protein